MAAASASNPPFGKCERANVEQVPCGYALSLRLIVLIKQAPFEQLRPPCMPGNVYQVSGYITVPYTVYRIPYTAYLVTRKIHTQPRASFEAGFSTKRKRRATRLWEDLDQIFPKPLFSLCVPSKAWFGEKRFRNSSQGVCYLSIAC